MKFSIYTVAALFFLIIGCKQKNSFNNTVNLHKDSTELSKAYERNNAISNEALSNFHKQNEKLTDSTMIGLSHHFYSEFMVRKNKFDSAYYYLNLSDKFFKNQSFRLFQNSIKKIYLLNKAGLLMQSKLEINKLKRFKSITFIDYQRYADVFSLPVLKQDSTELYEQKIDSLIKHYTPLPKRNQFLDNYRDNMIYKNLVEKENFVLLEQFTTRKLNQLEKEDRIISDIYFTNLFFIIKAKDALYKDDIQKYLVRFDSLKSYGLTREKEIQYYFIKAEFFKKRNLIDSAIVNFEKALYQAIKSDNLFYENFILKDILKLTDDKQKIYLKSFIKNNDSLINYNKYLDDFIFATNSENADLKLQQQKLNENYRNYGFIVFIIISIAILYFLVLRNKKVNAIAKKEQFYYDSKAKMFNYLLDIKNKVDIKIINKNEEIKNLIINDAIQKIERIEQLIDRETIDLEVLQEEILVLENKMREISHTIAESTNEILDLELLFLSLKQQFVSYFKIETFVSQDINIKTSTNNELLKVIVFIQILLNQIKFKENLTCFISVFKKEDTYVLRVWLNNEFHLKNDNIIFLKDRKINYSIEPDLNGTTILFPLNLMDV